MKVFEVDFVALIGLVVLRLTDELIAVTIGEAGIPCHEILTQQSCVITQRSPHVQHGLTSQGGNKCVGGTINDLGHIVRGIGQIHALADQQQGGMLSEGEGCGEVEIKSVLLAHHLQNINLGIDHRRKKNGRI